MPVLLDFIIKSLKLATGVVHADSIPQDCTSVANGVFKEVRIEAWYMYCDPVHEIVLILVLLLN